MLIAMKLSPYGVRPDLFLAFGCLFGRSDEDDAGLGLFFMGLPKSKAQIGWGRYWVVPAVGVGWLPTALGFGWAFAWAALVVWLLTALAFP
jgi:hypothetical protein